MEFSCQKSILKSLLGRLRGCTIHWASWVKVLNCIKICATSKRISVISSTGKSFQIHGMCRRRNLAGTLQDYWKIATYTWNEIFQ